MWEWLMLKFSRIARFDVLIHFCIYLILILSCLASNFVWCLSFHPFWLPFPFCWNSRLWYISHQPSHLQTKKIIKIIKKLCIFLKMAKNRKWNSKQLNNGVLTEVFWLPEFPKVSWVTIIWGWGWQNQVSFSDLMKMCLPQWCFPLVSLIPI